MTKRSDRSRQKPFTPEERAKIIRCAKAGASVRTIAGAARVSVRRIHHWRTHDKEFAADFEHARCESQIEILEYLRVTESKQWTAQAWIMERCFPDQYGRQDKYTEKQMMLALRKAASLIARGKSSEAAILEAIGSL